jgi:hypothetical protein
MRFELNQTILMHIVVFPVSYKYVINKSHWFYFSLFRTVEKHMKTFCHRERKKVHIFFPSLKQKLHGLVESWNSLPILVLFRCQICLTGLVGVHGMLSIPMSHQRMWSKDYKGVISLHWKWSKLQGSCIT